MYDLSNLTISEASKYVRQGVITPHDLVKSVINTIDRLEPTIKAWVTVDRRRALETARRYTAELDKGIIRGPLHGIPIGIKDIFYTSNMKTTAGSKINSNFIPDYDATTIKRLKKSGAIILGKTTTTEFAYSDPAPTRNPWNIEHTPGGSSSGSAAAVASGMCLAALGSQTMGSTIRPAAFCGIIGIKPTYGLISRYGVIPLSWSLDHVGVFTRSVEDSALLLEVLVGYDSNDATTLCKAIPFYRKSLEKNDQPLIGFIRDFYYENADSEVWKNTEETIELLKLRGAKIKEIHFPKSFKASYAAHRIIMKVEAASFHEITFKDRLEDYGPKIKELIASGLLISGTTYLRAQRLRNQFREEMLKIMAGVDCVLTPAAPTPALKGLENTGDPSFNAPWTFIGAPSITIPSGVTEKTRLPLGIQIVSKPFCEEKLLAIAQWCERIISFRKNQLSNFDNV
jgi:Asp-tRNA(Asn)/Glu-tRNA(Gln) amidotransferase A subunit family amidase